MKSRSDDESWAIYQQMSSDQWTRNIVIRNSVTQFVYYTIVNRSLNEFNIHTGPPKKYYCRTSVSISIQYSPSECIDVQSEGMFIPSSPPVVISDHGVQFLKGDFLEVIETNELVGHYYALIIRIWDMKRLWSLCDPSNCTQQSSNVWY